MKKNIFFGSTILLAITCCIAFTFQGNAQKTAQQNIQPTAKEGQPAVPAKPMLSHEERTAKIIESLKEQTLDETFVGLLNGKQFLSPGYHSEVMGAPREIESMLSARGFLKVLQQFDELPRKEAIAKLDGFCKRAIREYEFALGAGLMRYEQPEMVPPPAESPSIMGAKYMICMTILLAAKADQFHFIHRQIDEMYRASGTYMGHVAGSGAFPDSFGRAAPSIALLEDDCMFTVLMYAAKRAKVDVSDIPSDVIKRKTIPLYRWDSEACYYDFLVQRRFLRPDPKDAVEQFDVYEFDRFAAIDKRSIVTKLAERLKK